MNLQGNDPIPDELEATLAAFLRWRADGARGLPTIDVMTERVMGRTVARRQVSTLRIALVAGALLALLLSALWLGTGSDRSLIAVVPTESTFSSTIPVLPPTATQTPFGPCSNGRTELTAAAGGTAIPDSYKAIQAPANTRLATVSFDPTGAAGLVLVADSQPGTARAVATFTGSEVQSALGVRVVGWSPAGDELLVDAGHRSGGVAGRNCDNLFLVRTDGSGVTKLTDNGPQETIDMASFLADGSVLYESRGSLRHIGNDGADEPFLTPSCENALGDLQWSPDHSRFAAACDAKVAVVDVGLQKVGYISSDHPRQVLALRWTGLDSLVIAVDPTGTSNALVAGPIVFAEAPSGSDGSIYTTTVSSARRTVWVEGVPTFSPDSRWLLVMGDGNVVSDYFPTYLINSRTGASTKMPWPVLDELSDQSVAWLRATDLRAAQVVTWDTGKLYLVDPFAQQRTVITALPADDYSIFQLPD
jgi:hypothetical protein